MSEGDSVPIDVADARNKSWKTVKTRSSLSYGSAVQFMKVYIEALDRLTGRKYAAEVKASKDANVTNGSSEDTSILDTNGSPIAKDFRISSKAFGGRSPATIITKINDGLKYLRVNFDHFTKNLGFAPLVRSVVDPSHFYCKEDFERLRSHVKFSLRANGDLVVMFKESVSIQDMVVDLEEGTMGSTNDLGWRTMLQAWLAMEEDEAKSLKNEDGYKMFQMDGLVLTPADIEAIKEMVGDNAVVTATNRKITAIRIV